MDYNILGSIFGSPHFGKLPHTGDILLGGGYLWEWYYSGVGGVY